MKYFSLLIIFALSTAVIAQDIGGDYYVAVDGDDLNPGTYDLPFATWQKAVNVSLPGDTTYIRGGIYYATTTEHLETPFLIRPNGGVGASGTIGNNICYFAYPGESPILDGSRRELTGDFNIGISIETAERIHFRGLTVRYFYQYHYPVQAHGIAANNCANLTFENMTVHDISGRGFMCFSGAWTARYGEPPIWPSDTTSWINCDVYNLCDTIDHTTDVAPYFPGNAADGLKCLVYDYGLFILEGCRFWNFTDDGVDCNPYGRIQINNSWFFSSGDSIQYEGVWYYMEGNGMKISARNIEFSPYPYFHAAEITNCISAYNYNYGFYTNVETDYQNHGVWYNNTAYRNGAGFARAFGSGEPTDTVMYSIFRNNISYGATIQSSIEEPFEVILGWPATQDHNTWIWTQDYPWFLYNDTVTVTDADFVSTDVSQLSAARKTDGSLPDITFLNLVEGSDLIDAGVDVGMPYSGAAPDLGAVQFALGADSIVLTTEQQIIDSLAAGARNAGDVVYIDMATVNGDYNFAADSVLIVRFDPSVPTFTGTITVTGTGVGVGGITVTGNVIVEGHGSVFRNTIITPVSGVGITASNVDSLTVIESYLDSDTGVALFDGIHGLTFRNNEVHGSGNILDINFPNSYPYGQDTYIDFNDYHLGVFATFMDNLSFFQWTAKYGRQPMIFDKNSTYQNE